MFVLRAIKEEDTDAVVELAFEAGLGITTLPKNVDRLHSRVSQSLHAFHTEVATLDHELYLFVLEDQETGALVGISGLIANIGGRQSHYFYRIESEKRETKHLSEEEQQFFCFDAPYLRTVCYDDGPSEICSLYLSKSFRKDGNGRLLSLGRMLFLASHRKRFRDSIIGEMRGYFDENAISPLWEALGRKFLDRDLIDVMHMIDESKAFVGEILPCHPVYCSLLPESARQVIGLCHKHTEPALALLLAEGFRHTNDIDVLDGGPKITAEVGKIRSIKDSKIAPVSRIDDDLNGQPSILVATLGLDNYRACLCNIKLEKNGIALSPEHAQALQVVVGDSVRYVPASPR